VLWQETPQYSPFLSTVQLQGALAQVLPLLSFVSSAIAGSSAQVKVNKDRKFLSQIRRRVNAEGRFTNAF
jgi:hypothetical protein